METRSCKRRIPDRSRLSKEESTLVTDDAHDGSLVATEQTAQHKVEDQLFLVSLVRASGPRQDAGSDCVRVRQQVSYARKRETAKSLHISTYP